MKKAVFILVLIFTEFFVKGQSSVCYFLRDTGTVEAETSSSVVELGDGSAYVTGTQGNGPHGNDDIGLLKFDACGNVLWIKYLGDTLSNEGLFINKTSDQKLIIVGTTGDSTGSNDIFFTKLDSSGNILFQRTYGGDGNQSAKYIEQTSDKGFIFCGFVSDSYGSNDSYVVKTDSVGTIQWTQQVGSTGSEYADAVHELSDGNFIVTGDATSYGHGGSDVEVYKISKTGNIIWDNTYGDQFQNGCQGIIELSNGKYLSYGETETSSSIIFDFFIELIDTNGTSISRHTFGGTAADALFSLVEVPGMEFICTGYSRSYNGFQAYDVVLFKVDSGGQMKWLKNIYSPGVDIGYEMIPSINGDYLLTGLFGDNNGNYFLTRSDTIANTNVEISAINKLEEVILYPNPAYSTVALRILDTEIKSVTILSMMGVKLSERKIVDRTANCIIDLSAFTSGQYIMQITTDKGIISRKITKE